MARPSKGEVIKWRILTEKFHRSLVAHAKMVDDQMLLAATRLVLRAVRGAKRAAPVDYGLMRAGTYGRAFRRGHTMIGEIGTSVHYGKRTEFPNRFLTKSTRRIGLGTVEHPYTSWPALRSRGGTDQTMPWIRPAILRTLRTHAVAEIRRAHRGG